MPQRSKLRRQVLHEKLKNVKSVVARLQEENLFVKAHYSEIHQRLLRIVETRSPPFNDIVRLTLCENLKPTSALLNQIDGVSVSGTSSKQGGDEGIKVKEEFDQKVNEAYGSRKYKGKSISKDGDDENMTESERAERETRDKELDELNSLRKKFDAEDVEAKNPAFIFESHNALFPAWTLQQIQKESIDLLELYCLDTKTSFDTNNEVEFHLDFPLTPRAFLF